MDRHGPDSLGMSASEPARRGPIAAGLLLAALINGLDMTVVNVSLPHMQASLSASPEQITWVLTFFLTAQAVTTPISGWLAERLGMKTMLLACVALFTLTSMLCAVATSLPQMVVFRALQGVTGAPLVPLSQAVLLNISPPERAGRAMATFSMALVVAPIIGPVLGAYLTDELSWRWCFYINLPAGAVSLALLWIFMPHEAPKPRRFDFLGFGALAVALATFQMMLDRGPSQDWFGSREIWAEALLAGGAFWVYLTHTVTAKHPLFHPELARDRNFVLSTILFVIFNVLMFGSIALLPLMMQGVLGYPVMLSGMVSAPRGVMVMLVLQAAGRLDAMADRRLLIGAGLSLLALGFWLMGHFDLAMAPLSIVIAATVQATGQGLMTVPLTMLGFATLRPELRAEASSISNLLRMLGGSVGIASMQALAIANGQRMHASLAEHLRLDDPMVRAGLPPGMSPETVQGAMHLNDEITRQATMVAYVDDFRLLALLAVCSLPLLLLLGQSKSRGRAALQTSPVVD
jgi:DHA2 family multidrug resistance protein